MSKFRKKPVVIDAFLWTGDIESLDKWVTSLGDNVINIFKYDVDGDIYVCTLEGAMFVSIGDYIIRGVKGEYYPCKPDIFELTYDVEDVI